MALRQEHHFFKGMQRDLSASKFNPEFAFDALNIRITARDNNTLLSVTNEKGNREILVLIKPRIPVKINTLWHDKLVLIASFGTLHDTNVYIKCSYNNIEEVIFLPKNTEAIYRTLKEQPTSSVTFTILNSGILTYYYLAGKEEIEIPNDNFKLEGTIIGQTVINRNIILFVKGTPLNVGGSSLNIDSIFKIEYEDKDTLPIEILYKGDLNFNTEYPIESLGIYETDLILKVYWVDGLNLPRVINIMSKLKKEYLNDDSFNFVLNLLLKEKVTIRRNNTTNGFFSSGTILYAFTYYNRYGLESNIFYTSPLLYISFDNRGASPEEKVGCSFAIEIQNVEKRFDYIRIYSIHRASENATPNVLNVADISIKSENIITYIDNGISGTSIDPTYLLYVGGESLIPYTITLKDNTLFLGNIKIQRKLIDKTIKDSLKNGLIGFGAKELLLLRFLGYYILKNQLNLGEYIKTFKYLEWYRFGIQFLYKNGKWSEPVWINDALNKRTSQLAFPNTHTNQSMLRVVSAFYYLEPEIILQVIKEGYVKARGVVVYPTITDREVVAQGILCPTVYNVGDRYSNSPFALASWFSRPNLAFDIRHNLLPEGNYLKEQGNYVETKSSVVRNDYFELNKDNSLKIFINLVTKGAWAEFRHNYPIPNNWERNAEILCIANIPDHIPYTHHTGSSLSKWVANNLEYFFVDLSILTFHSPDIEFDENLLNLNSSNLKLRIVGVVPFTGNASDIDIQTSTPPNDPNKIGFYNEFIGTLNISYNGLKSLISGAFWFDKIADLNKAEEHGYSVSYMIYPWHRNGSLNNLGPTSDGSTRTAMLSKKKISNLKFSSFSYYFQKPWEAYIENDDNHTGITPISIFNSNELTLIRIPEPKYSKLGDLNYYGNVDKVVIPSKTDTKYILSVDLEEINLNKKEGYPIIVTGLDDAEKNAHTMFTSDPFPMHHLKRSDGLNYTKTLYGTDPVRIKYKSTPHAVFALNWSRDGKLILLPTTKEGNIRGYPTDSTTWHPVNPIKPNSAFMHFFWNPDAKYKEDSFSIKDNTYQDIIDEYSNDNNKSWLDTAFGYLYLAELYNDKVVNRFGGLTPEAFENNIWVPAGEPVDLLNNNGEILSIMIDYTVGDTFFLRYDCLKTYPYTLEDLNSVTEIVSFMCETRVNLDGRYDRNRGLISNLVTTPTNFNKINKVYNQVNNFFNYRGINYDEFNLNYFPNVITWTKEKQLGELIDTWTNLTMASTLDLDGSKGEITSLNTFNNEIFCFLRKGLSNILFNNRVLVPTSDGVPIEISNGLKVNGKRYISETIGCNNKWSIVESSKGIYFIDDLTSSIYLFNGQITSLADNLGFKQWVGSLSTLNKWDLKSFGNFTSFIDKTNDDIYFVNKDYCLCYSELLGLFTSFMSYNNVPYMFNVENSFLSLKDNKLWRQEAGDYNMFFGEFKPYSITFISNADPSKDKIFNNIEFRADCWDNNILLNNTTFNTLDVWNEYLSGTSILLNIADRPSSLKKKFRVWRANIPRDNKNKRDRIRNTWAYIKLGMNTPNTYRTEFHDAIIHYFI